QHLVAGLQPAAMVHQHFGQPFDPRIFHRPSLREHRCSSKTTIPSCRDCDVAQRRCNPTAREIVASPHASATSAKELTTKHEGHKGQGIARDKLREAWASEKSVEFRALALKGPQPIAGGRAQRKPPGIEPPSTPASRRDVGTR